MMKIGILGGTFDPVHNGHIYLAQTAMEKCSLNKVMFLPLNVPPHKPAPIADTRTRYELIQGCIKNMPDFFVSDMEIKRTGVTFTVDTLKDLKEQHPHWDIYYIIGTDTLYDLEKWKSIGEVFQLCSFICMARPGKDLDRQERFAMELGERFGKSITVIATMGKDVSSTAVRGAPSSAIKELVPSEIADRVIKIYAKGERK